MPPPILTIADISLTFGGTPLLEGAELMVSAGERLCLVGRNGSGKSTLLKIAAGLAQTYHNGLKLIIGIEVSCPPITDPKYCE